MWFHQFEKRLLVLQIYVQYPVHTANDHTAKYMCEYDNKTFRTSVCLQFHKYYPCLSTIHLKA